MPDFRFTRRGAVVDISVHDQPAADATSEGNIKNGIETPTCAMRRLAQCRDVRIVVHENRRGYQPLEPAAKFETGPASNLVRVADPPLAPIHGAAEANADCIEASTLAEFLDGLLDVPAGCGRTSSKPDRKNK